MELKIIWINFFCVIMLSTWCRSRFIYFCMIQFWDLLLFILFNLTFFFFNTWNIYLLWKPTLHKKVPLEKSHSHLHSLQSKNLVSIVWMTTGLLNEDNQNLSQKVAARIRSKSYSSQHGVARGKHFINVICSFTIHSPQSLESTYQKRALSTPLETPWLLGKTLCILQNADQISQPPWILPCLSYLFGKKRSHHCVCSFRLWWHGLRKASRAQSLALAGTGCGFVPRL